MTKSVYIIGGAGTGKSTVMAGIIDGLGVYLEDLEELWEESYVRKGSGLTVRVRLRGQRMYDIIEGEEVGIYLGLLRPSFPGTDALDNACVPVAKAWLQDAAELPDVILGEGMLLGGGTFLELLAARTDLLVMHLTVDEEERVRRISDRGHEFNASWSQNTVTRARNSAHFLRRIGVNLVELEDPKTDTAVTLALMHLQGLL